MTEIQRQLQEYLDSDKPDFSGLLAQWKGFDNKMLKEKAFRVYTKALKMGKTDLAKRIKDKYQFPTPDDRVTAFGLALFAKKSH